MRIRPIIFLDFDGVINTPFILEDLGEPKLFMPSDKIVSNFHAVRLLNWLYSKVPFDLVITSTWRLHLSNEELHDVLVDSGLNQEIRILGKTPNLSHKLEYDKSFTIPLIKKGFYHHTRRGHEIHEWLTDTLIPYHYEFIILDDDTDMWKYKKYLVKCNSHDGLTFTIAYKVLDRLKRIQEEIECQK